MKITTIIILLFSFCLLNFTGCATTPSREVSASRYRIGGVRYHSLLTLCEQKGIRWNYDAITRGITLNKGVRQVNLMVDSPTVVVNGVAQKLRYPVRIHKGAVVVSDNFKSSIIDSLSRSAQVDRDDQAFDLAYLSRINKVLIDPGHGGKDPGATGRTGLEEKDLNLDIAKRIKDLLVQEGVTVIMTRNTDKTVLLANRTRLANAKDVDLYISIHCNANRIRKMRGFEVYYLSPNIDDSERALSTAKKVDLRLEKSSLLNNTLTMRAILWDLIYTQNRNDSIKLAEHISSAAGRNLNIKRSVVRGAGFSVLKTSRMPAVLIEAGYLSNRYEEKMLSNNFYRQQIAESIVQGVASYYKAQAIRQAKR